jgi:hypothetical protein
MQTGLSVGCLLVLLLIGVPFAIAYPWRAVMVIGFFGVHVAVMVGYSALIDRMSKSQHPAARRFITAHATLSNLLADDALPDSPRFSKAARKSTQTVVYLSAFVFYIWLLLKLGVLLDWLEATPKG